MCLGRQILFEKELRLLARCFGKSEVKILQRFYALDFAESQILESYLDSSSGQLASLPFFYILLE